MTRACRLSGLLGQSQVDYWRDRHPFRGRALRSKRAGSFRWTIRDGSDRISGAPVFAVPRACQRLTALRAWRRTSGIPSGNGRHEEALPARPLNSYTKGSGNQPPKLPGGQTTRQRPSLTETGCAASPARAGSAYKRSTPSSKRLARSRIHLRPRRCSARCFCSSSRDRIKLSSRRYRAHTTERPAGLVPASAADTFDPAATLTANTTAPAGRAWRTSTVRP